MHFDRPLLKLPIRFDADALAAEVRALPQSVWVPHPTGFVGNEAVRLVSPNGTENDELQGPMAPTRNLLASPYMMKVMGVLGGVWSRSRDAPLLFERLGEIRGLEHSQFGKLVDQLGDVSHLILLGGPLAPFVVR
jgi:hypothetical protein